MSSMSISSEAERSRLAALRRYDILDTPPDGAFDRITALAASLFSVPISIISLVDTDRIWFKSHHGVDVDQIDREPGLCASAIIHEGAWVLNDASKDVRSLANPLVAGEFGLRFYAGVPLRTSDGHNLGTLCVIDREPREEFTEQQIAQLTHLAAVVMDEIELRLAARRKGAELSEQKRRLETLNQTGAAIAAELDLSRVVQLVTDAGVELTGARFGAFFYTTVDAAGESLMLYTLSGAERSDFERFGHPRATAVFEPTFKGEGVIRSDDITADPRYGKNPPHRGMPAGHLPVRSYLAVPVVSRAGDVIGGLFFGHPEAGVFTQASERLTLGLAGQAAVAIDNARLFEATQRANHLLEQRVAERTQDLEMAHEALRHAQKMEAIGQLTGGIAHDFNNLLTVIRGSADLLRRKDLPEGKRERYVEAISNTADRAAKLTGQLLAFARRQALKPELFDATQQVAGIADMLRTVLGSRIQLEIEAGCTDCFVEADAAQFETSLVNMAVNARDAMDGEGKLTIAIASETGPAGVEVVSVSVTDTGHGMDPAQVDRIFEPFYTTKEVGKGTGLGLSQVYGFVKQSQGEVSVETEPGHGTTFKFSLPKVSPDQVPKRSAERTNDEPPIGGRVLIVEDNDDVGLFASHMLTDLGFEAVLEPDGAAALARLDREGGRFDLVFSDVVMPGLDGVAFGRTVRERWPEIPVVLTSGYSHVLAQDTQHGFPLLQKPYSAEALSDILRRSRQAEAQAHKA
jgi:signal transduction histidine kinase/CheY-like chemotaxis protein